MKPEQSFQHTLREISVNRANPCELVRELVSNAYDARASEIAIFPLIQRRGLAFFDNGVGLSVNEKDRRNNVLPYVAFFSIGRGTKNSGEQIGYKCQGSKLCFASRRFSVITRCQGEGPWRWKTIENPKQSLDLDYDLTPATTETPWVVLREQILIAPDERTKAILDALSEDFFRVPGRTGTLLIIEDFETDDYNHYFSVADPDSNYLYNYLRFYTAHGDVRRIAAKEHGFRASDVKAVRSVLRPESRCDLKLWLVEKHLAAGRLTSIPQGWPYLSPPQERPESPAEVHQLRNGRFFARHATVFKYADRYYSLILAVDGNRRAHERYEALGRRGSARCGLRLSDQRGVILASNGIPVCPYPALLDEPLLKDWSILQEGAEHYVLFIEGLFELVTNRDALAPSSLAVLRDQSFLEQVRTFLQQVRQSKEGEVLAQLLERLNRETTRHREDQYIENNSRLRAELPQRESFLIQDVPAIAGKRFFSPVQGEEHFVGALYTLFAHLCPARHPLRECWARPITFHGLGIDAIAVGDEERPLANGNLLSLEYKFQFRPDDEFNHPLNITDRIVCWDARLPEPGTVVSDSYKYDATVKEIITFEGRTLGFVLNDVRHRHDLMHLSHEVTVLCLRELLQATFTVQLRPGVRGSTGPWKTVKPSAPPPRRPLTRA